jgi:hypothetical protein
MTLGGGLSAQRPDATRGCNQNEKDSNPPEYSFHSVLVWHHPTTEGMQITWSEAAGGEDWDQTRYSASLQVICIPLAGKACTPSCMADFSNLSCYHAFMKSDLRISVKDYR